MKFPLALVVMAGASFAGRLCGAATPAEQAAGAFQAKVAPILKNYCTDCHNGEKQKGKVNLAGARTAQELAAGSDLWYRLLEQIERGTMPPKDEEQPKPEERQALTAFVRGEFTQMMLARQRSEGRSKLRRLTRNEYANTVEDLFGARPNVDRNLPADGLTDGYDKVSTALSLSSEGVLGYVKMAEETMKWVLKPLPKSQAPADRTTHAVAIESGESAGQNLILADGAIVSFNTDNSSGRLRLDGSRIPGKYKIRVSTYGYHTDKPLFFGIYVGKTWTYPQELDLAEILEAPPGRAGVLETELTLREDQGMRLIPFGLGVPVPKNSLAIKCSAPGLAVQWLETVAPELPLAGDRFQTADFPEAFEAELRREPATRFDGNIKPKTVNREEFQEVMQKSLRRIGARLYRRDLTPAELQAYVDDVMKLIEGKMTLERAFFAEVVEMMTAPEFLCVLESPGRLSDFALASRLSYFLWSSTPDDKLMELAREGRLHNPKVLAEQTERLLRDPKFERFINDFGDQWLGLRAIADTSPDSKLYPEYDELLRFSSVRETRGYLRNCFDANLSVRRLVSAPWSLLNEPLANHYGVPGVKGLGLRKVDLPDNSPFGGLWTQSAIMKVTANGTNTSPVKRGVWVSERLLGVHIPPPPPNINPIEPDVRGAKTLRQQLAMHRANASCAACHARFDPFGFALESFDVVGGFRTAYRQPDMEVSALPPQQRTGRSPWRDGLPVDCTGETPDGERFAGVAELRKLLLHNPEQLAAGLTRHLITYATGTPPTGVDAPAIETMVHGAAGDDYGMRTLIHRVVQSELFQSK